LELTLETKPGILQGVKGDLYHGLGKGSNGVPWEDGTDPGDTGAPVDTVIIPVYGTFRALIQVRDVEAAFLDDPVMDAE